MRPFEAQAGRFADGLIAAEPDPSARLALAYRRAYARTPTEVEGARAESFLDQYRNQLAEEDMDPDQRERESWSALARALLASNEFLFVD